MDLLIIIIIIYFAVIRAKKKKEQENTGQRTQKAAEPKTVEKKTAAQMPAEQKSAVQRLTVQKAAPKEAVPVYAADDRKPQAVSSPTDSTTQEQSTTDYLAQKAKEDRMEHALEKRREEQRLRQETGGRKPALRHYYGDEIPPRMRIVKCGYCGAENLISERVDQKDYTCYFCREEL